MFHFLPKEITMAVDMIDAPASTGNRGLELVASYEDYVDAQRAVDRLADERFPVEKMKVVGEGLTFVENVTGRRGFGRAAGEGALGGAMIAGFVGLLFGLLNWFDPLISALALGLYGVLFGAVFGALVGLVAHALTRGERDFSSLRSMQAQRYDVLTEADVADEARDRLAA
jgi:hypothetical protein